jgi:hypothetical protein
MGLHRVRGKDLGSGAMRLTEQELERIEEIARQWRDTQTHQLVAYCRELRALLDISARITQTEDQAAAVLDEALAIRAEARERKGE